MSLILCVYQMEFDGEWTLSLDSSNVGPTSRFVLGNGKVGMIPSSENLLAVSSCFTSRPSDFTKEQSLIVNTIPSVVSGEWVISGLTTGPSSGDAVALDPVSNTLNMYNGTQTSSLAGTDGITATITRYAVRQFPYCTMQTCVVTSGALYDLQVQHLVTLPENDYRITNFTFSGNLLSAGDGSLRNRAILVGDGTVADSQLPVTVGVLYDVVDTSVSRFVGFQMVAKGGRDAGGYPLFTVDAGFPATFHALTCVMTGHDFANPHDEVLRSLLSIRSLHDMNEIRVGHSLAWARLWNGDVKIESMSAQADAVTAKQAVRTAVYMLYSLVRPSASSQLTVAPNMVRIDAGSIDQNGDVLAGDDFWLLPVLTLLNPSMARSLLEYRYNELAVALNAAKSLGYAGVRYPVASDTTVLTQYTNAWSPASNSKIYNTCLIGIHAWNHYRVTLDDYYLRQIAAPILNGVAQFVASRVTPETDNFGSYYSLVQVSDADGTVVTDDFMNCFLARFVLKCASECQYALRHAVPQLWQDIVSKGLRVAYHDVNSGTFLPYVLFDASNDTYTFPSTLMPLFPFWLDGFKRLHPNFSEQAIAVNYRWALQHVDGDPSPTVNAILAGVAAHLVNISQAGTADSAYASDQFATRFGALIDAMTSDDMSSLNVSTCAATILTVLSGVCGVYIQGGVQSNAVPYARMQVVRGTVAYMPRGWDDIILKLPDGGSTVLSATV